MHDKMSTSVGTEEKAAGAGFHKLEMALVASVGASAPPIPSDTSWITTTVALLGIAVFVISGSLLGPSLVAALNGGGAPDHRLAIAFQLNIALILFAWRRSAQLKEMFAERDAAENRAYNLAHQDDVTGLLNRRRLKELLSELCAQRVSKSAIILIDLDNFKKINDLYGHSVGDELLQHIAERLTALCPQEASCVRLGGDEFAVLLRGENAHHEQALRLAEMLVGALNKPIKMAKTITSVGVSIGMSVLDKPCKDQSWLLKRADIAMYEAKRRGRNRCVCFDKGMELELERRNTLEDDIRSGIESGEFVPFFQPIVDLASGGIKGFEVLARWRHPKRGLLEPSEFIELAETTGMISDLSFGVMHQALEISRDWPTEYKMALNISPVQFNDPLIGARIMKVLSLTRFPPSRLELEIKERSLLRDHAMALSIITSLKNQGVSIAIDDFGIGYASLTRLGSLPFDRIKIDRSLMASLLDDQQCDALVQAISGIGKGLKIPITAEGVETDAIRTKLELLGCATAQGWLFSQVLSAEEVRLGFLTPTQHASKDVAA
jgi:diguanylate cyclase (GGDEF)-like protein